MLSNVYAGFMALVLSMAPVLALRAQLKGDLIKQSLDMEFPFTILQYSTQQGLPQNQVVDIISKKNGNLIFSTANGEVEYNGTEFVPYPKHDAYRGDIVLRLFWHEGTRQLLGEHTDGFLRVIYPHDKALGQYRSQLQGDDLFAIDREGTIFKAHVSDLHLKEVARLHMDSATCIFYHGHKYYVGTVSGLYCYDEQEKKTQLICKGWFNSIVQNPYDHTLYAIARDHIWKLEQQPVKFFSPDDHVAVCQDIAFTNTGDVYIATTEGLYYLSGQQVHLYNKKNILPSQRIYSLYYNGDDYCLYLGTAEKGLLRLQLKSCYSYSTAQGFPESCAVGSLVYTVAGDVLAQGPNGLIYKVEKGKVLPYTQFSLPHSAMTEIAGKLYAATWGTGVHIIDKGKLIGSIKKSKNNYDLSYVFSLLKDSKGNLWAGTDHGVGFGTSLETMQAYLPAQITGTNVSIYQRKNGHICIGGSQGAYLLDEQYRLIKHLGRKEGLTGKEVRGFYEGKNGKLWIGTYDGGIYCYENDKLTSINRKKNAMLGADAFCFAPDQYGYLYLSSNQGLWRIKEQDLEDFYLDTISYLIPFFNSEEDGILNTEFNGGFQNNYLKTPDNSLYFPNIQGLVEVRPRAPVFRKLHPRIDRVFVNDTLSASLYGPLERNTSSIRFDFSCNSFLDKYNVYYQYKIERNGEKVDWSAPQKNGTASFHSLRPGQYAFTVRAIDAFNDRDPIEIRYSFEILPYFYETAWFISALAITFLALTVFVGRLRVQMYRRKAEEKERYKRQLAELELKAIHDRMNPHFVFNSLNSIKYYLSVDDKENANKYLDGFSILLRKFTEYSSQNFISVREEMEIIGTYVQLERMRMNNGFEAHIEVDPETLNMLIPTINIQPFVENAIKHGIAHSTKPCYLRISLSRVGEHMLKCVIEDNGIGRKRSQEINASRKGHVSSGIKMVEEKKQIIKALYSIGITLHIEDKVSESGEALGTIVTLIIPAKHD